MGNNLHKKVLVELDCILDTRIACIAILSAAHAAEILSSGYFERQSDEFWKRVPIQESEYKALYNNRGSNPAVLENSHLTMFTALMLKDMVKGLLEEMVTSPFSTGFTFVINQYPHELSPEECQGMKQCLYDIVGVEFSIDFVRLSPEQLTPSLIENEYCMLTMYDYEAFIRAQGEAMCRQPIRTTKLYCPAIFNFRVPSLEDMQEFQRLQVDPFSEVRLIASPMIDLEFLHISNFSVLDIKAILEPEPVSEGDKFLMGMAEMDKPIDLRTQSSPFSAS